MNENNSDIFEISQKTQISDSADNFFLADKSGRFDYALTSTEQIRHLNDYDLNILKDGAYKEIDDDAFKLEYQIAKAEEEIKAAENIITAANEIKDFDKVQELQAKLIILKSNHEKLLNIYNEKAFSAKITGTVSTSFSKFAVNVKNLTIGFYNMLISKLPPKFSSVLKIKQSIEALKNINNSVDNLVSMTVPYGESPDRYKKLSKYIIKANSIQAEISKYIKGNSQF